MRLPLSTSPLVMLLMLVLGLGLGMLCMTGVRPAAPAVVMPPPMPVPSAVQPVSRPLQTPEVPALTVSPSPERYIGVTFARHTADVVARIEGRVEAVYVHLGDHLRPGDVIATIVSSPLAQQVEIAEASVRSAQAEARHADVERRDAEVRYQRRAGLVKAGLLSKEELATAAVQLERANMTMEVAQARLAEHKARLKQARDALSHTVITATFAGTVAARYLDPGATVLAGSPVVNVMRTDDLWIRFATPVTSRVPLPVDTRINVSFEELHAVIPGLIKYRAPDSAALSQEVIMEAQLLVPAAWRAQLKPGLSGHVTVASAAMSASTPTRPRLAASQGR